MYKEIKSFEDACAKLGIGTNIPEVSTLPDVMQKQVIANYKLVIVAKAVNNGWQPDWNNSSEYKYYPWFEQNASGDSFVCCDYVYCGAYAVVGSRLCFVSSEIAEYMGTTFIDLYNEALFINA